VVKLKGIIKATLVCLMLLAVFIALSEAALSEASAPVVQDAPVQIQSQKIIDALNKDLEGEWSAFIQYKKHHWEGELERKPSLEIKPEKVIRIFDSTAMDELKHIDKLGERIVALGGTPTKKPEPIVEGGDLKKMVQDDLAKENSLINQYREHIKLAIEENQPDTRLMLEKILSDEEDHADTWEKILGIKKV
jgi:bacterioferritin